MFHEVTELALLMPIGEGSGKHQADQPQVIQALVSRCTPTVTSKAKT